MAAKNKDIGVITGVYNVNLHCPQCARKIEKRLLKIEGIQSVDADFEKAEIKVKGVIDVIKIHKLIQKTSQKKVELISPPLIKIKEIGAIKEIKEKEVILRTTTLKVHIHCAQCEHDLRKKLLKHKVQGTIESDRLLSYLRKKVHKHAEIVTSKQEKKEEIKKTTKNLKSSPLSYRLNFNVPYFIHYVYAPQLFSDENPNACSIL
ncbi:Heavy metal-associated isoprenylated plant protein 4 [Citrus sinensis]|uniref:Heavy metal-associated isoprenylated plant protein 4 n=1 Tax=Citrus sinensis TaxID=2711 RepID=A0ACB8MSK2_CITSI|nr:Heavy metal-associated isoprenylated plant protein 4 [Citrus sinensis]